MLLTFSAPTNSSLDSLPPHPLPPLLPLYNMSMSIDQLSQNPSQTWIWQPTMDNPQHYYYHNQVEHHQQQQQHEVNYDGKEHMFEKPLTPSDVGKLNRLVIPKQHAERYFPIDNESGEKGLLLSFVDEGGKTWKFRYSYWTSSQSYVLTKGWSRFVKEKRLDAGDVVHFERYRPGSNDYRLFIGCRRRGGGGGSSNETPPTTTTATTSTSTNAALPWSPPYGSNPYPSPYYYMNSVSSGERGSGEGIAAAASPVVSSTRRLRLFGVNLECGPEPPQHLVSSSSSWSQFTNNA